MKATQAPMSLVRRFAHIAVLTRLSYRTVSGSLAVAVAERGLPAGVAAEPADPPTCRRSRQAPSMTLPHCSHRGGAIAALAAWRSALQRAANLLLASRPCLTLQAAQVRLISGLPSVSIRLPQTLQPSMTSRILSCSITLDGSCPGSRRTAFGTPLVEKFSDAAEMKPIINWRRIVPGSVCQDELCR